MNLGLKKVLPIAISALAATVLVTPVVAAPIDPPATYLVVLPNKAVDNSGKINAAGGRVLQTYRNIDTLVISIPPRAAANIAASNPTWIVEKDQVVQSFGEETALSWGQDRIDTVNLSLDQKYSFADTELGSGVTAYVIDTGIRADHEQFDGTRVIAGFRYYPDNSAATGDCGGHGTHVAGTIGGNTVGIADQVTLVPVVVLDCSGSGSSVSIAAGADWVVDNHKTEPAVANMSLGGGASSAIDAVVEKMIDDGITVVVAAGNSNRNACNYSPARVPRAITVGASTNTDARAYFSNYGSCVDLYAPGVGIYSSVPTSTTSYDTWDGTSMATPAVAGVVARYLGVNKTANPATVWTDLSKTLTLNKIGGVSTGASENKLLYANPSGYANWSGLSTKTANQTVPAQVSGVKQVTGGTSTVNLSWQAPFDGGSPITGYNIEYSTSSSFTGTPVSVSTGSPAISWQLASLSPNLTYYVRIKAVNAKGSSTNWSSTLSSRTALAAPTNLGTNSPSRNSINLTWTAPTGTVAGYVLQVSTAADFSTVFKTQNLGTSTSVKVGGLNSNTLYYFRLQATNSLGYRSDWSSSVNRSTTR